MVIFGQKVLYSGKSGFIRDEMLYSRSCSSIWPKWFGSDKSGCLRTRFVLSVQNCCICGKLVVFGAKWLYSDKSGCILLKVVVFGQKWLYSGKVVVFRQKVLYSGKVVVYGQKRLYSGKCGCIREKWLY